MRDLVEESLLKLVSYFPCCNLLGGFKNGISLKVRDEICWGSAVVVAVAYRKG